VIKAELEKSNGVRNIAKENWKSTWDGNIEPEMSY
jgi:hypothetical protein